jgi:hypothetical protein
LKDVYLRKQTPELLSVDDSVFDYNNHVERVLHLPSSIGKNLNHNTLIESFKNIESEENPELTDWSFSELRYNYVSKEKIEELGIQGFILLKIAGKPDKPSINQYLKSRIEDIEETEEYKRLIDESTLKSPGSGTIS